MRKVRKPAVAGQFYPADAQKLRHDLEEMLSGLTRTAKQPVKIIVCPHAGYLYSGKTAAQSFEEIKGGHYDRVVMLGPVHHYYFEGIVESNQDAWQTPLGEIKVVSANHDQIIKNSRYHDPEHCLEVQTPFLKYLLPEAEYIPLLVSGGQEHAKQYAQILSELDTGGTLWVISSDFTHFGPQFGYLPKNKNIRDGRQLDHQALELIQAQDTEQFKHFLFDTGATICGALPVLIAMYLIDILKLPNFTLKDYSCSADITNDVNSVGYASLYS